MDHDIIDQSACRERRYQWIINVLLVILGFFAGILFEAERMKAQVVSNTVEIRLLRDTLDDIREKIDTLIDERRTTYEAPTLAVNTDTIVAPPPTIHP